MKQFNLHTPPKKTDSVILKIYTLVFSSVIIALSIYTWYAAYKNNIPIPTAPIQQETKSALYHAVHILEELPELEVQKIECSEKTITLVCLLPKTSLLTPFLKKISPHYTIVQAKTTEDMKLTLELKTI